MTARDVFFLDSQIAPRLVRILYGLMLILIALGVIVGVLQGVQAATRMPPMPPLSITGQANPGAAPAPGMVLPGARGQGLGRGLRGQGLGPRRFGPGRPGPLAMSMRRTPALLGAFMVVRTLVAGIIGLLVIRILAEMALSVLALRPKESA